MRAFRRILLLVALGCVSARVRAAPLERDLGQGLTYFRIHEVPGDLPSQVAGPAAAWVVDLRYAPADRDGAAAFAAWLKFRATVRAPVFVLANRETAVELRRTFREPHRGTGIVVLGIAGQDFAPDVVVRSTPEDERAAYDALAQDAPLAALLTDHPDKLRNDEARLAKTPLPAVERSATGQSGSPGVDAALQRAVHLHRSLAALRREQNSRGGG